MKTDEQPRPESEIQTLARLSRWWNDMVAADQKAERCRREVDRLIAEAMAEGIGTRAIGRVVGVDHSNVIRRAQRHRRTARKEPA